MTDHIYAAEHPETTHVRPGGFTLWFTGLSGSGKTTIAHLVGPDADEVINLFAIEIRHGLTAKDIEAAMLARWRPPTSTIWSDSRGPRSRKFAGLCLQVIPPRSGSALGIDVINLGRTSTERCSG